MAINTSTLGDLLKHRYSADFIREMQGTFCQYADLGDWVVQVYVPEMRTGSILHRCRGEEYEHVKNPVGRIPKTGVERCESCGILCPDGAKLMAMLLVAPLGGFDGSPKE